MTETERTPHHLQNDDNSLFSHQVTNEHRVTCLLLPRAAISIHAGNRRGGNRGHNFRSNLGYRIGRDSPHVDRGGRHGLRRVLVAMPGAAPGVASGSLNIHGPRRAAL